MKTALWIALALALAAALYFLPTVDFAGAGELDDFCRRGTSDAETEVYVRDHAMPQPSETGQAEPEVAPPSMKEGESHRPDNGGLPVPGHGPDLTPPRASDAGGPGRVVVPAEPGPLLSAWGFVAWLPDGRLYRPAGGLFDDPYDCAQARAARRQQAPHLRLSPCTRLEIGERERL